MVRWLVTGAVFASVFFALAPEARAQSGSCPSGSYSCSDGSGCCPSGTICGNGRNGCGYDKCCSSGGTSGGSSSGGTSSGTCPSGSYSCSDGSGCCPSGTTCGNGSNGCGYDKCCSSGGTSSGGTSSGGTSSGGTTGAQCATGPGTGQCDYVKSCCQQTSTGLNCWYDADGYKVSCGGTCDSADAKRVVDHCNPTGTSSTRSGSYDDEKPRACAMAHGTTTKGGAGMLGLFGVLAGVTAWRRRASRAAKAAMIATMVATLFTLAACTAAEPTAEDVATGRAMQNLDVLEQVARRDGLAVRAQAPSVAQDAPRVLEVQKIPTTSVAVPRDALKLVPMPK